MASRSTRVVHADEKRHLCHYCGAKRYESRMRKLSYKMSWARYNWANDEKCWACKHCYKKQTRLPESELWKEYERQAE